MSIHALRETLELVPEAIELCKSASVSDGFPTDSRESTLASALKINYMTKIAGERVSSEDMVKVSTAIKLYKLASEVESLSEKMSKRDLEKKASHAEKVEELRIAETYIESQAHGIVDLEKVASASSELYDAYSDDIASSTVRRYACGDVFIKQAAVEALNGRHRIAPHQGFDKLAHILEASDFSKFDIDEIRSIASCVTKLEKRAHLTGLDFYKEAFMTKEAAASALMVTVDKQQIPVENILRAPVGQILGEDVAREMGSDPYQVKAVVEALPLDMQKLLISRVR